MIDRLCSYYIMLERTLNYLDLYFKNTLLTLNYETVIATCSAVLKVVLSIVEWARSA